MMLVPYRKDYRKIILGILSFIPGLHDYDRVAEEVDWSLGVGNPIYLWQNDENGDFSGAAIVELGPEYVLIRRISFMPSARSGKNVYAFLTALHQKYANRRLMGTMATQPLITNWEKMHEKQ